MIESYQEVPDSKKEELLNALTEITSKVIMFVENFLAFFSAFFDTYGRVVFNMSNHSTRKNVWPLQ